MDVPNHLLQLLYFVVPAYTANMAAQLAAHWHGWNRPISERWLGSHKTVVGLLLGVFAAMATTGVQHAIAWRGGIADYGQWVVLGAAFGMGALGGDALKSALKRRAGIPPGDRWIPADQLDFIAGALVLTWHWAPLDAVDVFTILGATFAGHIMVDHVAYWLGIRDTAW